MGCLLSKPEQQENGRSNTVYDGALSVLPKPLPKALPRDANQKYLSQSLGRYLQLNYASLFTNNRLWIIERLTEDQDFFTNLLTASLTPDYL